MAVIMRKPDVIFIDFYGTITSGDLDAVLAAAAIVIKQLALPLTPGEFAQNWSAAFFDAIHQSSSERFQTLHACETTSLCATVERYRPGIKFDLEPAMEVLDEYWRNPPLQPEVMRFFDSVDCPVCCISNADQEHLEAAIARHGLPLDAVVCSETVRSYKPDAAIFEAALRTMNVRPEQCCHLGDSLTSDIEGAARLGIPAFWIKRENRIFDGGEERSVPFVNNLLQVPFLGIGRDL